ncbi:hypothetical protein FOL47_001632 [Perkinsus chesapeaki]|uniref:Uncharacterized protein n=1 Tax=Perkinsus chesapeaki TaxID=330153 RepID=A0A7J6N1Y2_PERCH|nr:hypothetical protein FOL47_001632 [Perkinsus chesapeaki]
MSVPNSSSITASRPVKSYHTFSLLASPDIDLPYGPGKISNSVGAIAEHILTHQRLTEIESVLVHLIRRSDEMQRRMVDLGHRLPNMVAKEELQLANEVTRKAFKGQVDGLREDISAAKVSLSQQGHIHRLSPKHNLPTTERYATAKDFELLDQRVRELTHEVNLDNKAFKEGLSTCRSDINKSTVTVEMLADESTAMKTRVKAIQVELATHGSSSGDGISPVEMGLVSEDEVDGKLADMRDSILATVGRDLTARMEDNRQGLREEIENSMRDKLQQVELSFSELRTEADARFTNIDQNVSQISSSLGTPEEVKALRKLASRSALGVEDDLSTKKVREIEEQLERSGAAQKEMDATVGLLSEGYDVIKRNVAQLKKTIGRAHEHLRSHDDEIEDLKGAVVLLLREPVEPTEPVKMDETSPPSLQRQEVERRCVNSCGLAMLPAAMANESAAHGLGNMPIGDVPMDRVAALTMRTTTASVGRQLFNDRRYKKRRGNGDASRTWQPVPPATSRFHGHPGGRTLAGPWRPVRRLNLDCYSTIRRARRGSPRVGGGGLGKSGASGSNVQGSLLRNLAQGQCTILPALEDLAGLFSDDEDELYTKPPNTSRTNTPPARATTVDPSTNIVDYYGKSYWREKSLLMDAELDNTIEQLDNFLLSLYGRVDEVQSAHYEVSDSNSSVIEDPCQSRPPEGQFTKQALLRSIHPSLVRDLALPDASMAREQRLSSARLSKGLGPRPVGHEQGSLADLRAVLQQIKEKASSTLRQSSKAPP